MMYKKVLFCCYSNNSANFADALDSYISFKINQGEAAFGN